MVLYEVLCGHVSSENLNQVVNHFAAVNDWHWSAERSEECSVSEAYEMAYDRLEDPAAVVTGPVVTRYTSADQNLRTTFEKIVKRAGLTPWPKPFQNLRATRKSELMDTYSAHVVVSRIGHSEKVAREHYLQTTDAHFGR